MALSAKQHILKLRETEYKLQKLQNNLLNINKDEATMSEFLAHHKELMALPGSNRDSVPFRFSFEAPKRYVEMKQAQKLTLPPKIPLRSASRLSRYKDNFEDELDRSEQKIGNRSKALHSLLNELEKQASKMVIAFPKLDKLTLLNKTPFLRSLQNSKHNYFSTGSSTKKFKASSKSKAFASAPVSSNVSKLASKASISKAKAKKLKMMWNKQVSGTATSSTPTAELIFPEASKEYEKKLDQNGNVITGPQPDKLLMKPNDPEKTGENLAYALGASNLMGVILPPQPSQTKSRGPNTWTEKRSTVSMSSAAAPPTAVSDIDDSENISAKEAMTILRRRKFPERKSHLPDRKSPHERGLIGIEISSFEPQCAFFYRDRNGNYNPHLYHSKNITEGLKKAKPRRNNPMKHSLG